MRKTNQIVKEDVHRIVKDLGRLVENFRDKKILITGFKGFLGSNFTAFFHLLNQEILNNSLTVYCLDNSIVDLEDLTSPYTEGFTVVNGSGLNDLPVKDFNYIIHCAGIASPTFYRKYPLETISVNSIGYWEMLNNLDVSSLEGFLYFSTSEIYGDPDSKNIPTKEEYRGNVSCTGPRACYDESKRLGETISIAFHQEKGLPIKIVRPFNVYGPFMRLNDRRVIPDFVKFALEENVINILSDGTPTRAFCYSSDAINGFIRALLLGKPARPYNIGNGDSEISMLELANIISMNLGGTEIKYRESSEKNYLTDNPQRRCPVIGRAKTELNFKPAIHPSDGIQRVIEWYKETYFPNK